MYASDVFFRILAFLRSAMRKVYCEQIIYVYIYRASILSHLKHASCSFNYKVAVYGSRIQEVN